MTPWVASNQPVSVCSLIRGGRLVIGCNLERGSVSAMRSLDWVLVVVMVLVLSLPPGDCDYLQAPPVSRCSSCSSSYSPCSCPSPAPVDCEWSPWSWSACSVSCGAGGRQEATRFITRYSQHGGRPCGSVSRASRDCEGEEGECPADCVWGQWSQWGCSGNKHLSSLLSLST